MAEANLHLATIHKAMKAHFDNEGYYTSNLVKLGVDRLDAPPRFIYGFAKPATLGAGFRGKTRGPRQSALQS